MKGTATGQVLDEMQESSNAAFVSAQQLWRNRQIRNQFLEPEVIHMVSMYRELFEVGAWHEDWFRRRASCSQMATASRAIFLGVKVKKACSFYFATRGRRCIRFCPLDRRVENQTFPTSSIGRLYGLLALIGSRPASPQQLRANAR